jgi:hypothetical protein
MRNRLSLFCLSLVLAVPLASFAESAYTTRPDDPNGVYLDSAQFGVRGDGTTDDTAAIQAAIDRAAGTENGGGLLFIPSGRYRLSRTVFVWRGVRVIGFGKTRPVFVLAPNTPGYQKGIGLMVMFTHARPGLPPQGNNPRVPFPPPGMVPPNDNMPDATPSTFYSGISNVDFEIGDGNPAAVAIRFHVAQHGVLNHIDFQVGSGLAALTEIGNEAEDIRIYGGRYGILTDNTSPFWQFTLIDSVFDGQRDAAIREHMAQLTLVRTTFRNVPVAVEIDREYSDQVWIQDSRFEHVSKAAVLISNEKNPTTQVGVENAVCVDVPTFARFRESGRTQAGSGEVYRVARFNYGLIVPALGRMGRFDALFEANPLATAPAPMPNAIRALPPSESWMNVRTLGVKGDGKTDDTDAIKKAVDAHPVLYFPAGYYIVRDTIRLKPDTVLIALHPGMTHFDLPNSTPGFDGVGPPKAVIETPQGGTNIVSGLGIFTGGINPRATALLWMAGETSLVYDVQFLGGGGTYLPPAVRSALYTAPSVAFPFAAGRWGAQYPSLWVTRNGGGTFANIWTPSQYAQSGMYVSDTKTPGYVYELSAEHHLFNEIKLDHVENWRFYAPQTEEEAPTSPDAVSFEIAWSRNITIANYHGYRVTRTHAPFPAAVRLYNSFDIRFRNIRVNAESGYGTCDENGCGTFLRVSKFPYENAIQDVTHDLEGREREFAVLDVSPDRTARSSVVDAGLPPAHEVLRRDHHSLRESGQPHHPAARAPRGLSPSREVVKLEGGFYAISGATVDANGTLYFVDRQQHRIFAWSRAHGLQIIRHDPLDPVNLAVDKSGALMVVSSAGREGTVYSFDPRKIDDPIKVLQPEPSGPLSAAAVALPANVWVNGEFANQLNFETFEYTTLAEMFAREMTTPKAKAYVSPDRSLVLPAVRVFRQEKDDIYPGMDESGWRWSLNLTTYGLVAAPPGRRILLVSSAENRTYSAVVEPNGTLGDLKPFADRGGESVAVDSGGNVYVANGQIFVYDRTGKSIRQIDVPERPMQLVFGGRDRRTLFILTHHALYAVQTVVPGTPFSFSDGPH